MVKTKDRSQLCLGLDIFETKMENISIYATGSESGE